MNVIDVEITPNPNARKFVLDGEILAAGSRHYDHPPLESEDALAARLFAIPGVNSVFYMGNFVTVDKAEDITWEDLRAQLQGILAENIRGAAEGDSATAAEMSSDEVLAKINKVLDEMVRPALAGDGGGLRVVGLRGNDLYINYQGACGSCPSATAGTMAAIQNLLRAEVNEELSVYAA